MSSARLVSDTPSAPTDLRMTSCTQNTMSVQWSAPDNDGGSPITGYTIHTKQSTDADYKLAKVGYSGKYMLVYVIGESDRTPLDITPPDNTPRTKPRRGHYRGIVRGGGLVAGLGPGGYVRRGLVLDPFGRPIYKINLVI